MYAKSLGEFARNCHSAIISQSSTRPVSTLPLRALLRPPSARDGRELFSDYSITNMAVTLSNKEFFLLFFFFFR